MSEWAGDRGKKRGDDGMSRINPCASTAKRTFQAALIHLLESDCRIVGSHRILRVMAEDVEALVEEFYPQTERVHNRNRQAVAPEGIQDGPGQPPDSRRSDHCPV
jgi:hypothetical protein